MLGPVVNQRVICGQTLRAVIGPWKRPLPVMGPAIVPDQGELCEPPRAASSAPGFLPIGGNATGSRAFAGLLADPRLAGRLPLRGWLLPVALLVNGQQFFTRFPAVPVFDSLPVRLDQ